MSNAHARAHARAIPAGPRMQAGHLPQARWQRPDAARIAAISSALAINLLALLLLLLPMSMSPPKPLPEPDEKGMELMPPKPEIVEIVRPLPPLPPQVQPRDTTPRPQPRVQPVAEPAAVIAEQGTPAVPVVVAEAREAVATEPATPSFAAVRLEYASAPPPAYPRDAQRRRLEGTVLLQVLVDVDGRPLDVQVQSSSGHRVLDEAARKHVLARWTFRPAMKDGRAVQAIGLVPLAFELR